MMNTITAIKSGDAERIKQLKYDIMFRDRGGYQTNNSFDLNPLDLAYRADTKQEYYSDYLWASTEIGLALVTGGTGRIARTTYTVLKELLTN